MATTQSQSDDTTYSIESLFTFDPVGNLAANRIQNEPHVVNEINGVDHNYLIPRNAPFFETSMIVVDKNTGEALTKGTDYFFAHAFQQATEHTGHRIAGAIAFTDPNRTGQFLLNYQTLGGTYVDEQSQALADGMETLNRLLNRRWEDLVEVPTEFPPTPHTHRLDHVVGVPEILAKFEELKTAILSPERHITMADIVDIHEGYVEPLTQAMAGIQGAVTGLSSDQNLYYVEVTTGPQTESIGPLEADSWAELLSATVSFPGTYFLRYSGNPVHGTNGSRPELRWRFIVNGQPVSTSALNGTMLGLSAGDTVTLQIMPYNTLTSLVVANTEVACGLTLLRASF